MIDGSDVRPVEEIAAGARMRQSLTDQSRDVERRRSERSTGPRAGWKESDMTGAAWPL